MNEFLRKFDIIRFVAPWSIFRNFFGNFSFFWIQIWILNLCRFGTGPNRNRTGPVPTGKGNHAFGETRLECDAMASVELVVLKTGGDTKVKDGCVVYWIIWLPHAVRYSHLVISLEFEFAQPPQNTTLISFTSWTCFSFILTAYCVCIFCLNVFIPVSLSFWGQRS